MLEALRRGTGSWVVKILLGLLVLSFAAWGIGDIFRIRPEQAIAEVGSQKISGTQFLASYNRELRRLQQQLGQPVSREQALQLGLVQRTLDEMVARAAIDEGVQQLGLTAGNDTVARAIANDPAFRGPLGRFDRLTFEAVLRENGFNEQSYVEARRRDLARGRLELAEQEQQEIEIIHEFLPRPMSESEIADAAGRAIAELGASGPKDMGRIMALLKERHAGRMDLAQAGAVVRRVLTDSS